MDTGLIKIIMLMLRVMLILMIRSFSVDQSDTSTVTVTVAVISGICDSPSSKLSQALTSVVCSVTHRNQSEFHTD